MNRIALFLTLFAVFIFSPIAANVAAQTSAPNLDTIFKLMDSAAKDFHSLTADIEHIKYTAVVRDTSTEIGQISVRKDGKMRIDFKSPDPRTILRNGDSLYIYTPKISRVEEYNLGKNRAMADQYLALGFGTKSDTLKKTYDVSVIGEEDFDGKKTVLLQLIPKTESVRAQLTKIQMWVDESSWLPLQQKFFETGSGDYFLSHYTNVMKNLKINDAKFKPNWPKDVKVEKPRG
ncbi:MAG TPA: outer membrane lipoprotein-sorting protein [Candidatus Eremiobacteraceae bacterium]|nr:outer membrane lipoprotein-sorting protein [Candidatus Eremiobacteraceae bacterium]